MGVRKEGTAWSRRESAIVECQQEVMWAARAGTRQSCAEVTTDYVDCPRGAVGWGMGVGVGQRSGDWEGRCEDCSGGRRVGSV